ncbi:MAG: cation-translocating P-type ATPase [Deltaproteobacteria bacterium]|nr:cation-translocating P-type ATPase [Deltaproteobacteria bacterium]
MPHHPSETQEFRPWHMLQPSETLEHLRVEPLAGLPPAEVDQRLREHGPNELVERGLKSPWRIVWEQATAVMSLVLLGAAAIKGVVAVLQGKPGEWIDAGAILVVVLLNVLLGFIQEYRAEKAMAALKNMAAPVVWVRRGGRVLDLPARDLVPGDIVLVEAGNAIPADMRLIEGANLRAQEASLTGESLPVEKSPAALHEEHLPLGDRANMLYSGTAITYGRGTALVVATGMRTELGRIAELLQAVTADKTPLQRRIGQLGLFLGLGIVVVVVAMSLLGIWRGEPALEMLMASVAVAVAAIPEGLPTVMTITLALGAQRMLKRGALIRKLPAVETLGSVTTICSDKTGTLTENKMQVTVLDVVGHTADLTEVMQRGHPILEAHDKTEPLNRPEMYLLLGAGALCNDALLQPNEPHTGEYVAVGDPTEGAILVGAAHYGLWKMRLEETFPRVAEAPFSSERKRMTTVHRLATPSSANGPTEPLTQLFQQRPLIAFTKGSADGMVEISSQAFVDGVAHPLTSDLRRHIAAATDRLAQQGLRVLGVGYRALSVLPEDGKVEPLETELTFVGLIGMIDPPRPEVKAAVERCLQAGIRPVMITGDHPLTALEIARQLHIAPAHNGTVLTGHDLAAMSPEQLRAVVEQVSVYARVSPEHKLNIVQALQERGHVVAMTGDGVNDAPALRRSDIGVAMGITGTDVSKEAANMVITDDNFATIVSAVEEGRTIYDNVRKFVKYIVTSNSAEVTVMFLSQLFGMPLPMTTLQILWMNLVTDGVPGLALGLEPTEKDTMRRPPFAPNESIFSRGIGRHILIIGAILALVSFGIGYGAYQWHGPAGPWGTMVFMTLTLSQLGHAMAVRSNRESLFTTGLTANPTMLWAVGVTLVLQLVVTYTPPVQAVLGTQALTLAQLGVCLAASTIVFWAVEIEKWLLRRTS